MNAYPKNWSKISARVRTRADNRCQRCGVGPGELYTRFSGEIVSEKEFERLGKAATRSRRERNEQREEAKKRFLSPLISEAEMSGDYDTGYFADGGFYPIEGDPRASLIDSESNNNCALRFEVHHIDGDKSNNEDSNLEFLCKRCHMHKHRPKRSVIGATLPP